ncbi:MAG: hypothetical protein ACI944_001984 [Natronomonas sp.]|jgi:hypothetical protein
MCIVMEVRFFPEAMLYVLCMVEWQPRDEMGILDYLRFKLGRWVRVSTLPEWVNEAHNGYYDGYVEAHGHRPYDVEKVYTGDSLEYKIYYRTVEQGVVEPEYYVKLR